MLYSERKNILWKNLHVLNYLTSAQHFIKISVFTDKEKNQVTDVAEGKEPIRILNVYSFLSIFMTKILKKHSQTWWKIYYNYLNVGGFIKKWNVSWFY